MREDITAPIVGMLGSDRERVRSSALGAISQLARAGGEARHRVFSEPFLLPRLLDVTSASKRSRATSTTPSVLTQRGK